jgi:hypothetical protein
MVIHPRHGKSGGGFFLERFNVYWRLMKSENCLLNVLL